MRFKAKVGIVFVSTLISLYAIIGGFLSKSSEAVTRGNQYAQYAVFDEVLGHIIREYVDEPDLEKVRIGSLRGLAEGLDAYSAYLTAQQVKTYAATPGPAGTGMFLSKVSGYAYVVSVLKGSPADLAGIRAGDFIEYVGKVPSRDLSLYDVENLLAGPVGTSVSVRIVHLGQPHKITFNLGRIVQPAEEARTEEPGIGYIKVTSLAEGKTAEVRRQLVELTNHSAQKIVLDLRGSAGGSLQEGVSLANLFVGSGNIAEVIGKQGVEPTVYTADPSKVVFTGPLVVVTDRSTAGPAEVIAAAVKDARRGDVVGEKTFGMGSEQKLFPLSDGGALLITVAKFAPASGKPLMDDGGGIDPTVKVEKSVEAEVVIPDNDDDDSGDESAEPAQPKVEPTPVQPVEDVQLKKAIEILKQTPVKTQAAASKRAALCPMDHPSFERKYEACHPCFVDLIPSVRFSSRTTGWRGVLPAFS